MDIGQNITIYRPKASYRLNFGQNENIGIGIGDRYVGIGEHIGWDTVSVSAGPISVQP
jgi:hypothetical protein